MYDKTRPSFKVPNRLSLSNREIQISIFSIDNMKWTKKITILYYIYIISYHLELIFIDNAKISSTRLMLYL